MMTSPVAHDDQTVYGLAAKGNPTALLPLYAPAESVLVCTPLGAELRSLAPAVLSRRAVDRFLGYLEAQRRRLLGRPSRPELIERYGYDVKYASHALRLAYQGLELVEHGRLTLPMPDRERERVLAVKRGEVTELAEVVREIETVEAAIGAVLDSGRTPLPAEPDLAAVTAWAADAHRRHWGWAA